MFPNSTDIKGMYDMMDMMDSQQKLMEKELIHIGYRDGLGRMLEILNDHHKEWDK
tara:strand:+ start:315 stop:479 length:165 start_codon:yes stop_codon:yes gene_type:complete